jgi:hypothetical protein
MVFRLGLRMHESLELYDVPVVNWLGDTRTCGGEFREVRRRLATNRQEKGPHASQHQKHGGHKSLTGSDQEARHGIASLRVHQECGSSLGTCAGGRSRCKHAGERGSEKRHESQETRPEPGHAHLRTVGWN